MDIRSLLTPQDHPYNRQTNAQNQEMSGSSHDNVNKPVQNARSPSPDPTKDMSPAHAAYLSNGAARLRILSQDPFRSSATMRGGEIFRLSSARWLLTSPMEQRYPGMTAKLMDDLHRNPSSFEKKEGLSTHMDGAICYLSQQLAAVLDLHPDGSGKFVLASVALPDIVCSNPALAGRPVTNPIQEYNLATSEETLKHIRRYVYKPNFKSGNKKSAKRDDDYEAKRIANARPEIDRIRALPREQRGHPAYMARGHNCTDLIYAAHYLISSQGGLARPVYIGNAHAILLVGDNPGSFPVDMKEWPDHLAVCDPWTNIACLAKEYPSKFMEKMEKWASEGKKISTTDIDFVSPTDPDWIRNVLEGEKSAINLDNAPAKSKVAGGS